MNMNSDDWINAMILVKIIEWWHALGKEHRDRIYIRKDIFLALYEYGELNQSQLMRICGLNNVKHKEILDDMVDKGFLERREDIQGNKTALKYKISQKGLNILKVILEPYEELFPRKDLHDK